MKPVLIYDGDCGFCLYWIKKWNRRTEDRVDYAPYQTVGQAYPQIASDQFERSVQLVKPDGEIVAGAKAVFETLACHPDSAWLLRTYKKYPLFAKVAESVYDCVAKNRHALSTVFRWFGIGKLQSFLLVFLSCQIKMAPPT